MLSRKEITVAKLKNFATQSARPLPVVILADTSGSMSVDGKIESLNLALKEMLATFKNESRLRVEIQVAIITFGSSANIFQPLTPAHTLPEWQDFSAAGSTPLGGACRLAQELIEDKSQIFSRAYKPVIILLSDGQPTDDYEQSFQNLINSERAKKATRLAMAIGNDADIQLLADFNNDIEASVFEAHQARDIQRFFRAVTMSVCARSTSQNPDEIVPFIIPDDDNDEFPF